MAGRARVVGLSPLTQRRALRPAAISPFAAQAARRQLHARLVAQTFKINAAIEAAHTQAMGRAVRAFTHEVAAAIKAHHHDLPLKWRHDALLGGGLAERFHGLAGRAKGAAEALGRQAFGTGRRLVEHAGSEALRTMGALAEHGKAVAVDFASDFAVRAADTAAEWMLASIDRAESVIDTAAELGQAMEWDTFTGLLDAAMDGVVGRAMQSARNAVTQGHAELVQEFQTSAGVEQYVWVCINNGAGDDHVRGIPGGKYPGHHWDLNMQTCDWDDPPLKGDESSSGEDCHAGDDYGCRCGAAPVLPSEDEGGNDDGE